MKIHRKLILSSHRGSGFSRIFIDFTRFSLVAVTTCRQLVKSMKITSEIHDNQIVTSSRVSAIDSLLNYSNAEMCSRNSSINAVCRYEYPYQRSPKSLEKP